MARPTNPTDRPPTHRSRAASGGARNSDGSQRRQLELPVAPRPKLSDDEKRQLEPYRNETRFDSLIEPRNRAERVFLRSAMHSLAKSDVAQGLDAVGQIRRSRLKVRVMQDTGLDAARKPRQLDLPAPGALGDGDENEAVISGIIASDGIASRLVDPVGDHSRPHGGSASARIDAARKVLKSNPATRHMADGSVRVVDARTFARQRARNRDDHSTLPGWNGKDLLIHEGMLAFGGAERAAETIAAASGMAAGSKDRAEAQRRVAIVGPALERDPRDAARLDSARKLLADTPTGNKLLERIDRDKVSVKVVSDKRMRELAGDALGAFKDKSIYLNRELFTSPTRAATILGHEAQHYVYSQTTKLPGWHDEHMGMQDGALNVVRDNASPTAKGVMAVARKPLSPVSSFVDASNGAWVNRIGDVQKRNEASSSRVEAKLVKELTQRGHRLPHPVTEAAMHQRDEQGIDSELAGSYTEWRAPAGAEATAAAGIPLALAGIAIGARQFGRWGLRTALPGTKRFPAAGPSSMKHLGRSLATLPQPARTALTPARIAASFIGTKPKIAATALTALGSALIAGGSAWGVFGGEPSPPGT